MREKIRETIVLASGINGTELIRTMARFGQNTLRSSVMGAAELAEYSLMRSGVICDKEYISGDNAASLLMHIMEDISYYSIVSYADAVNLYDTLYSLREQIVQNEHEQMRRLLIKEDAAFDDANEALFEAYERYMDNLDGSNQTDEIGLIRFAIENARPFEADIKLVNERMVSPLARALAKRLIGEKLTETDIASLYGLEKGKLSINAMTCSYGAMNEARDIML